MEVIIKRKRNQATRSQTRNLTARAAAPSVRAAPQAVVVAAAARVGGSMLICPRTCVGKLP